MDVSIIVPVWNQHELTDGFFRQNARYAMRDDIEFVVVDNGSTDKTPLVLKKWQNMYRRMRIAELPENMGFGVGNNIGAAIAGGDFFIFTQNDVTVNGDYVKTVLQAMRRSPSRTMFGATLVSRGDSWNTFGDTVIKYLQGWFLAMRKEVWWDLGGFDDRYSPCDYEDMDLSHTARMRNISLQEVSVPLTHMFGGTTRSLDRLTITKANQLKFKEKWGLE